MAAKNYPITLGDIELLCTSLGNLFDVLMDRHSLALVVGNMGHATFSKRGSCVLSEVGCNHPLQKLIVNAGKKYVDETGDDCKLFMLLLKEIMCGAKDMLKYSDEVNVRKTLLLEISAFMSALPLMFVHTRNACIRIPSLNTKSFADALACIVLTSLESNFSLCVARQLADLVQNFVLDSILDWNYAEDALQYLILHFESLCSKAISPLSKSVVMKGFIINQRLVSHAKNLNNVHFIIVWNLFPKADDAIWSIDLELFPHQLSCAWTFAKNALMALKSHGVGLILTPDSECDNIHSFCSQIGITLICRISRNDIDNIMFFCNIFPLNSLNEVPEVKNIGHLESLLALTYTDSPYTHLETSAQREWFIPNHILLCAPTDDLWKEYFSECSKCLKVIKQWLDPWVRQFRTSELKSVKDNSEECFEQENVYLDRKIMNALELIFSNNMFNNLACFIGNSVHEPCVMGMAVPLGLWEFVFKTVLTNIPKNKVMFPNFCKILDSTLLNVICKNWNMSIRNFAAEKSYLEFYERMNCRISNPLEPTSSKEKQLCAVLQLVQQLLRIDSIVSGK